MKSRASVGRALDATITRMPPRKASKAAKPPGGASAASGFEASPEALATAARAAGELWWWDAGSRRWRTRDACVLPGAGAKTALKDTSWTPWHALCDTSEAPYFRWFAGAETNACFNACDRHVLDGRGDEVALTALPEEITDATPRVNITRRELLGAVATVAARLRDEHGVRAFDRVLFHMPTDVTHCVYMLACQRLGAAYSATAVDAAEDVLVSRIEDLHPKLVVAAPEGATKHAGVAVDCAAKARRAAASAGASVSPPAFLEAERDFEHLRLSCRLARWASMSDAQAFAEANARQTFLSETDGITKKAPKKKTGGVPACLAATPVPSDHPLFVSYTSGSTGKPKGIVHGHGGYVFGVLETMRLVFECSAGEGGDGVSGGILTVGSSGWITGQSYMLMGPLLAATRSVLMLGSPVFPSPLRAFETIETEKITVFKSGSAVVRQLMTDPANAAKLDAVKRRTESHLRVATFCAEPVSAEVHAYAQTHVTRRFINSYWATEHGSMVFSRDVSRTIAQTRFEPDTKTYPLPWVRCAINDQSDVVLVAPYPSLALTVFGDAARCGDGVLNAKVPWRGDLRKFEASYWPRGAGGFVQGDVARKHAPVSANGDVSKNVAKSKRGPGSRRAPDASVLPGYTFHGRSDEVINVNGNRVGTEQIERCLWDVQVGAWRVRDCAVVGAPDFVKGDAPVAFVAFTREAGASAPEPSNGAAPKRRRGGRGLTYDASKVSPDAIDAAAFKAAAAVAVTARVGAYAAPDHVFVVEALPKTITNKTSRKTLQLLLAGESASDASLARRETLPPIAAMVSEWRKTGATTNARLDLAKYWDEYTFSHHVVQGRPIVPGAGWLCMLAAETDSRKLADVAFMRGVHSADADVRVTKRRKALQATVGDEVVLRAVVAAGAAAPHTVGPTTFGGAADFFAREELAATETNFNASSASKRKREPETPSSRKRSREDATKNVTVTEEATAAQHYRRCDALRLEYAGAYRAVAGVEWSGHVFRAEVAGTHLAAVLDAGLQVACAAVRAATFIPVAVKEFHLAEAPADWTAGARNTCTVHGEIVEQHADYLVADLRYERFVASSRDVAGGAAGSRRKNAREKKTGKTLRDASSSVTEQTGDVSETFAAMGRVRFARVEGTKPRLQPDNRRPANESAQHGRAQTLDPATSLARLRQLTPEQRVEAVRAVVRATVLDLTDQEVDFDKTTFDNGMHSLNAVELLSRVNETLGTGVTTKLLVADAPMGSFAEAVAAHAMTYEAPKSGGDGVEKIPFPNVDYATLNELVRRRLAGKTVGQTPYFFLAKYFAYNWFKKAFQFFRIGGPRFVLDPPRAVDLGVEVSMDRRVEFRDIDMNQHYTVEMIVARSVDGVEQLMARSGLSHVELYYKRNLFAAKIQSTFHKELALGDRYFIKTKITKVTGSLMDIRVAFLDENEVLCFEILWTILIVLDSTERVLLDWENVDLMEGKRLRAGPGKSRVEAPATPKKPKKTSDDDDAR